MRGIEDHPDPVRSSQQSPGGGRHTLGHTQTGSQWPARAWSGLQWGDEAKGKIVDLLGDQHDFVVRYNGGANAGPHRRRQRQDLQALALPTGVLRPNVTSVIGNGVVVYPPRFLEEVDQLAKGGIDVAEVAGCSATTPTSSSRTTWKKSAGRKRRRGEDRHHRPRHRPLLPGQGRPALRHPRRRTALCRSPPRTAADRSSRQEPADDRVRQWPGGRTQAVRRRRRWPTSTSATPSGCGRSSPTRRGSCMDAVKAGQACALRGGPGQPARRRSRHLSLCDQLEQLAVGHLERLRGAGRNVTRIIGVVKAYTTRVGRGPFPTELDDGPRASASASARSAASTAPSPAARAAAAGSTPWPSATPRPWPAPTRSR